MSQTIALLTIEYHTDDESGVYDVGEVDYGISVGPLDDYLKAYGENGRQEIVKILGFLAGKVGEALDAALGEPEVVEGIANTPLQERKE